MNCSNIIIHMYLIHLQRNYIGYYIRIILYLFFNDVLMYIAYFHKREQIKEYNN